MIMNNNFKHRIKVCSINIISQLDNNFAANIEYGVTDKAADFISKS